jgi:predicted transport protein
MSVLEPLCDHIYVDLTKEQVDDYINLEQPNTLFDLSKKISISNTPDSDIKVRIDGNKITNDTINLLQQLPHIIKDSGEVGKFKIGDIEITIDRLTEYQDQLGKINTPYYTEKLV